MIRAGNIPSHALGPKKGGAGDSFLLQKGHLGCNRNQQQQAQHVGNPEYRQP
jgi:hypothetical protein